MSAPLRAAGRCLRRLALERSSGARSVLGTETDKAFAGLLCGGGSDFQGRHSATVVSRRTFESEAYAWDHEHRPYLSRREREIISAYHHPSREYLKLWEGDETLRGTLSEEAEARGGEAPGAIADQGKLVDRIVPVVNRSLETVGELALPGLIYDQPLRKVSKETGQASEAHTREKKTGCSHPAFVAVLSRSAGHRSPRRGVAESELAPGHRQGEDAVRGAGRREETVAAERDGTRQGRVHQIPPLEGRRKGPRAEAKGLVSVPQLESQKTR